ncbi:hypothetical protein BDV26DRAFT_252268 [Aspergillus bertholletiae]|uniref:Uncharacterized protein n=1 Tax=Aspergillus bertholletiae TaxID=1226010 RepID=A0A5N7BMC1_9EURO|nr:hypothetical protein BDV26DRAFT_252268 [Aspergillus bertholletiae]
MERVLILPFHSFQAHKFWLSSMATPATTWADRNLSASLSQLMSPSSTCEEQSMMIETARFTLYLGWLPYSSFPDSTSLPLHEHHG